MTRLIDVHHHVLPKGFVDAIGAAALGAQGSSGRLPRWSVSESLELMDAAGIDAAVTSITSPAVVGLGVEAGAEVARQCNEAAATMVADHPRRFGMFATVPLGSIDAALAEVDYAFGSLKADGVCLMSNYEGKYLGHDSLDALYMELDRRSAVIFVHPTSPVHPVDIDGASPSTLEFPFDTTRTIVSLALAGVFTAYPAIRWIFAHAGGTLPYLAGRLEMLVRNDPRRDDATGDDLFQTLRSLYYDTAVSADHMHFQALRALVPDERIVFGSDYPFAQPGQMADTVQRIDALGLEQETLDAIYGANAESLFPRLTPPTATSQMRMK